MLRPLNLIRVKCGSNAGQMRVKCGPNSGQFGAIRGNSHCGCGGNVYSLDQCTVKDSLGCKGFFWDSWDDALRLFGFSEDSVKFFQVFKIDFYGIYGDFQGFSGILWHFQGFCGILLGCYGFLRILWDFDSFFRDILRFYGILLGLLWILMDF